MNQQPLGGRSPARLASPTQPPRSHRGVAPFTPFTPFAPFPPFPPLQAAAPRC
ncbi:MAG: hypothetical protein JWQ72_786 [Polaromonas sp.]|nr:hypothetical protein [Polaromonas sp.]